MERLENEIVYVMKVEDELHERDCSDVGHWALWKLSL